MYRGKHVKPVTGKKNYKKAGILLASIVLILVLTIGTTVAYLIDQTSEVENIFNPTKVDITVNETLEGDTKSNVKFTNTGDIPVYVRAKVVVNWIDSNGNITTSLDETKYSWTCVAGSQSASNALVANSNWILNDGFYYYNAAVPVNGATENLFDSITMVRPATNPAYTLRVDIISEAIQVDGVTSGGTKAVVDAWGIDPTALSN